MTKPSESTLESSVLDWLQALSYQTGFAPEMALAPPLRALSELGFLGLLDGYDYS